MSQPVRYLNRAELAARIGVEASSLSRYLLPDEDALVGEARGWLPETVDLWHDTRPGRGNHGSRPEREGDRARDERPLDAITLIEFARTRTLNHEVVIPEAHAQRLLDWAAITGVAGFSRLRHYGFTEGSRTGPDERPPSSLPPLRVPAQIREFTSGWILELIRPGDLPRTIELYYDGTVSDDGNGVERYARHVHRSRAVISYTRQLRADQGRAIPDALARAAQDRDLAARALRRVTEVWQEAVLAAADAHVAPAEIRRLGKLSAGELEEIRTAADRRPAVG